MNVFLLAQSDNAGAGNLFLLINFALYAATLAGMWGTFVKADKPGWAALIPIYNLIVILELAGKPLWWILLLLVPCANVFAFLILTIDFAKAFGRGPGFGVGLALLGFIFWPLLGFGDAKYVGVPAPSF
jgi:hypothetical protein